MVLLIGVIGCACTFDQLVEKSDFLTSLGNELIYKQRSHGEVRLHVCV